MIHDLITQKKALLDEAKAIQERVYTQQSGEWRGDDTAKFDELTGKADAKQSEIERLARLDKANRSLEDLEKTDGRRSEPSQPQNTQRASQPSFAKATAQDQDMALRGWLIAGSETAQPTDAHRDAAKRCGINLSSKHMTLRLAPHALRSLEARDVAEWERRAALTGAQSTTTTGGYTVADSPMAAIERALLAFGGMRQVATVIRTETGGPLPFPTSNDTSNKGAILAENTTVTELDITFGQLVLDAYKYSSKSVLASVEFLQDTSINAGEFIGTALGERIGRIQNDHFTTGTGSSQPNGIVTAAASSSVTFASATTVTYDNIVDLIHSVDPAYRMNGKFMLHDGALKMLKKVKVLQYSGDTTGVPLWQPSLVIGQPDLIHGYPYVINQSMTTPATTVKSILFGDFSKYIIRDVREVTLLRLDERYADAHQVGFLAFARSDGDLKDAGTNAVKYGTQA